MTLCVCVCVCPNTKVQNGPKLFGHIEKKERERPIKPKLIDQTRFRTKEANKKREPIDSWPHKKRLYSDVWMNEWMEGKNVQTLIVISGLYIHIEVRRRRRNNLQWTMIENGIALNSLSFLFFGSNHSFIPIS